MPKRELTFNQIKELQAPFSITEEDLLLISNHGNSKIITLSQLKNFFNNLENSDYMRMQGSIHVPIGYDYIEVLGNFSSIKNIISHLIKNSEDSPDLFILNTVVTDSKIRFNLSSTCTEPGYTINYSYLAKKYSTGNLLITSSIPVPVGSDLFTINGNFTNVLSLVAHLNYKGSTPEEEVISILNTTIVSDHITFKFSSTINNPNYVIVYEYVLSNSTSVVPPNTIQSVDLPQGVDEYTIAVPLTVTQAIANVYSPGEEHPHIYVTDIIINSGLITFKLSDEITTSGYRISYIYS